MYIINYDFFTEIQIYIFNCLEVSISMPLINFKYMSMSITPGTCLSSVESLLWLYNPGISMSLYETGKKKKTNIFWALSVTYMLINSFYQYLSNIC